MRAHALSLLLITTGCSSTPNRFSKDGREEIRLDGDSVDARHITVVQTRTLDEELNKEHLKRESAQKWAAFWEQEYRETKAELVEARLRLGLPAERPPCPASGCKEGQARPSMSISEEIQLTKGRIAVESKE